MMVKFGEFGLKTPGIKAPPIPRDYLYSIFEAMEGVRRYGDEDFDPVFWETDQDHVMRLRQRAMELPAGSGLDIAKLLRMVEVHDMPEVGEVKDVNGVKKELNPQLAYATDEVEEVKARKMFGPEDWELYQAYGRAGIFWKGKAGWEGTDREAAVAYILDKVDGNEAFHFRFRKAVAENKLKIYPPISVLEHLFKQAEKFYPRMEAMTDKQLARLCRGVLDDQLRYMGWLWFKVPINEVPEQIRAGLDRMLPEWRNAAAYE